MDQKPKLSGTLIKQSGGYSAFMPDSLPPKLDLDMDLVRLISDADLSLGRLNGLASIISDPDLFVYLYVRKEALLSSQIEGTQCSLEDVLADTGNDPDRNADVEEVSNYVSALNRGLKRIREIPYSNRLIRELHEIVLQSARGSNRKPGQFRSTQNWIGRPGGKINEAYFIPPPPTEVENCMGRLEEYVHSDNNLPALIKAALIHAQFETIHPFLDGNGRLGRLIITLLLCNWEVIDKPLVYLSYFFKANRTEYYSRLMDIRLRSDWHGWLKFFLRGVAETAKMANSAALEIHELHIKDRERIIQKKAGNGALEIHSAFMKKPISSVAAICELMGRPVPTVQRAVDKLIKLKILKEVSGQQRNRRYAYTKYLDILKRDTTTEIG